MKLLFCGDLVCNKGSEPSVSNELQHFINSHEHVIVNFEGAIRDNEAGIIKAGPCVCNDKAAVSLLKKLQCNVAALSNNHIMDFGISSLNRTLDTLHVNNIRTVGADISFNQIYEPLLIEEAGEKVALLNVCQAEFGVCKNDKVKAGYAWINHPSINNRIIEYKRKGYSIIIFAHAGVEDEEYILPEWRTRYHDFIDLGADCVIATHPHIFQGVEQYKGKYIAYSLGNFYFPWDNASENWRTGLIASVDTTNFSVDFKITRFTNDTIDLFINGDIQTVFEKRCSFVSNDKIIEENADILAESTWNRYYKSYYENLEPHTLKQLLKLELKKLLGRNNSGYFNETLLLHNLQIESHRWCVERYLYNKNCKDNNLI